MLCCNTIPCAQIPLFFPAIPTPALWAVALSRQRYFIQVLVLFLWRIKQSQMSNRSQFQGKAAELRSNCHLIPTAVLSRTLSYFFFISHTIWRLLHLLLCEQRCLFEWNDNAVVMEAWSVKLWCNCFHNVFYGASVLLICHFWNISYQDIRSTIL